MPSSFSATSKAWGGGRCQGGGRFGVGVGGKGVGMGAGVGEGEGWAGLGTEAATAGRGREGSVRGCHAA